MKILISSNPEMLDKALEGCESITVEAEYGDICIPGSIMTLAHHGSRSHNPPPCKRPNVKIVEEDSDVVIGISHIDMDTIGGIMSVRGLKDGNESFWDLVAFIDINGLHKLDEKSWPEDDVIKGYACQALLSSVFADFKVKENTVEDVTEIIEHIIKNTGSILKDESNKFIELGKKHKETQQLLNKNSYVEHGGSTIVRVNAAFTNHLYRTPEGKECKAVVAYRTPDGSITISFADPLPTLSCCRLAQFLWGSEAGGRDNIAGSPRGCRMTLNELREAYLFVDSLVQFQSENEVHP